MRDFLYVKVTHIFLCLTRFAANLHTLAAHNSRVYR